MENDKTKEKQSAAVVVSAEKILECLLAEFDYWKECSDSGIAIGATGAIANVVAFATVPGWRAEWHPEKEL